MRVVAEGLIGDREDCTFLEHPSRLLLAKICGQSPATPHEAQVTRVLLPLEVVLIRRVQVAIDADHQQLERRAQLSQCCSVEAMQEVEVRALEAVRRVQHAAGQFDGRIWIPDRRDPITPQCVQKSQAYAVVIRNPDRDILRQAHDAIPDLLLDGIGRRNILSFADREFVRLELASDCAEVGYRESFHRKTIAHTSPRSAPEHCLPNG